jgi:hypothetical protein
MSERTPLETFEPEKSEGGPASTERKRRAEWQRINDEARNALIEQFATGLTKEGNEAFFRELHRIPELAKGLEKAQVDMEEFPPDFLRALGALVATIERLQETSLGSIAAKYNSLDRQIGR